PAAPRPARSRGRAQLGRTVPALASADALFGAADLGALHVYQRLRNHCSFGGRRDDVSNAVRLSLARADGIPLVLHATRTSRDATAHFIWSRDRYRLWIRRPLAVWLAGRAASHGHWSVGRANRRGRFVAGFDRRVDDSAESGTPASRGHDPHHLIGD